MAQPTDPPVFFVSYARADAEYGPDRGDLQKFVDDLSARVSRRLARPRASVGFFDSSSIDAGELWTNELAGALSNSTVGLALYTPFYFTRPWCGKEFQAFIQRAQSAGGPSGIVPVLWMRCTTFPPAVSRYQYADATFPAEYAQVGMQQLLRLQSVYRDRYELALEALATRIEQAAASGLAPLPSLDVTALRSAWDVATAADAQLHTEGGVSKTCFVFVSRRGWDWMPYANTTAATATIGALAQQISGQLGLRYEEITYDATLSEKLDETNRSCVPTVLIGDPDSLRDPEYAGPMNDYDRQFLLNCGALIPWDEASQLAGENDARWAFIRSSVCRQKTEMPPPFHEWRSIFSQADLELKTKTTIEQLRSRLMKQLMSDPAAVGGASILKAEDQAATDNAASQGIRTESPAQLDGPRR